MKHKKKYFRLITVAITLAISWLPQAALAVDDLDGDGILDNQDNCIEVANPDQRDTNNDGHGNVCDADLDNNGSVSFSDLDIFKSVFGSSDADADLDGNGSVSFSDLDILKTLFSMPPGPSAPISEPVDGNINFNPQQRLIADQFVSIFENGTSEIQYGSAEDIGDGRGITAGRAGFTSATGDMLIVIEKYTKLKPKNSLATYTKELKRLENLRYEVGDREGSASTKNLNGLIEAWAENAKDPSFRTIQDEVVNGLYFQPALKLAKSIGAKLPLTLLSLYDTNIMHGESGLKEIIEETNKRTDNSTPKDGADEIIWLKNFNAYRKEVMLADDTWKDAVSRVTELTDLIEMQNYQLEPFKMVIQAYSDETHNLPANTIEQP